MILFERDISIYYIVTLPSIGTATVRLTSILVFGMAFKTGAMWTFRFRSIDNLYSSWIKFCPVQWVRTVFWKYKIAITFLSCWSLLGDGLQDQSLKVKLQPLMGEVLLARFVFRLVLLVCSEGWKNWGRYVILIIKKLKLRKLWKNT